MKYLCFAFFLWFNPCPGFGQDTLTFREEYMQEYMVRIQKSHIDGFYIPKDLPDAMRILNEIVDDEGKEKFASREESEAVNGVFFSFGRWINVNWGMERGSRLSLALNKLGVSYPDDMTRLIMYAFHRHLNDQPLDIENLVNKVIQYRLTKEEEARKIAHD